METYRVYVTDAYDRAKGKSYDLSLDIEGYDVRDVRRRMHLRTIYMSMDGSRANLTGGLGSGFSFGEYTIRRIRKVKTSRKESN